MEKENNTTNPEDLSPQEEIIELKESLESLEKTISDTNSTKKVIWRGILTGLSGIVGATIVFGLIVTIVSWILYNTGIFPQLNEFLNGLTEKGSN
jgi:hypothetical protein